MLTHRHYPIARAFTLRLGVAGRGFVSHPGGQYEARTRAQRYGVGVGNSKPPGRSLRSASRPASADSAISGGVREPMFSPIGRCTRAMSASGTPSAASASHVRTRVPGVAHHADPARRAGQHVPQHRPQLGAVVVGDDDVGVADAATAGSAALTTTSASRRSASVTLSGSGS